VANLNVLRKLTREQEQRVMGDVFVWWQQARQVEGYLSTAQYRLYRPVSTPTLEIQLAVYDAVTAKRRGESFKTLAEIGVDMKLVRTAMPRAGDHPHDAAQKRNIMAATVSRHFRAAQRMIANVVKGEFPNSR